MKLRVGIYEEDLPANLREFSLIKPFCVLILA